MPSSNKKKSRGNSTTPSESKSGGADESGVALPGTTISREWAIEPQWKTGDRVLCRYLTTNAENIYYEAKITDVGQIDGKPTYAIHYQGWNIRHDERIVHDEALKRFKEYTKEAADQAKEELRKAQAATTSAKKRKSEVGKRLAGDESSRASTPSDYAARKRPAAAAMRRVGDAAEGQKREIRQVLLPDALRKILIDDENLINKSMLLPKIPARITVHDIVQQYRQTLDPDSSPREFYIEYAGTDNAMINPTSENLERSALGLLDYFESTVGSLLLYKFERPMFNDLTEKLNEDAKKALEADAENNGGGAAGESGEVGLPELFDEEKKKKSQICYSKQFGLPHLLRMFVRFSEMLSYTQWSERSLDAIIRHAQDFVLFLAKNHADYYNTDQDYIIANPQYHKRVWASDS